MNYGRSVFKALDKFNLEVERWPDGAGGRPEIRSAWRTMLKTGITPPAFRPAPPPLLPSPSRAPNQRGERQRPPQDARVDGAQAADAALLARMMR